MVGQHVILQWLQPRLFRVHHDAAWLAGAESGRRPGVVDLAIRFASDGSRTMRRFRSHQRLQVATRQCILPSSRRCRL